MNQNFISKHLYCSRYFQKKLLYITEALFEKSPVKYFSYNRYFRNQTWIGLYTDIEPVEKSLAMDAGPLFLDAQGVCIDAGVYFHGDLKDILKSTIVADNVERFFSQENNKKGQAVVQNGLLIIRKGEIYDESFYFSMLDTSISNSRAYYFQSLNIFKKFCLYFLHKSKDIIEEAHKYKITYDIPPQGSEFFSQIFWKDNSDSHKNLWFDNKKFCIGTAFGAAYLSQQELNCLRLVAKGYTYNEVAEHLGLQFKTVESYIQNIKNKLNAESRAELAELYRQFAVLDVS